MKAAGEGSVSSSLRARRLAAAWLDAAGFLLVTGLSLLVAGRHRPVEEGLRASALIVPFTWVLAQTLLMAVRGRSVGSLVAGFRFERAMGGAAPGAWRALVHRAPV
ncbi:MAG: hypothetical protein RL199_1245, partial [Pseudomonadota bacterium]